MPCQWSEITGFVLAGGASRRMGRPKQDLVIQGTSLLWRQCSLLGSVCSSVAVVGLSSAPIDGIASFPDEQPGLGPLGGIHTSLMRTRTEYNLFVGCDMPFITRAFLRYLCRRALAGEAEVTVPESSDRRLQPLCALYRRRARSAIRASIENGLTRTTSFYLRVRCDVIPWREVWQAGFRPQLFANVNTPEDYAAANRAFAGA